jgi:hypothetical protein
MARENRNISENVLAESNETKVRNSRVIIVSNYFNIPIPGRITVITETFHDELIVIEFFRSKV